MKKHYVLIDYENVQPEALGILDDEAFHVIVFVGANQSKVSFEVASALQRMGNRAFEWLRFLEKAIGTVHLDGLEIAFAQAQQPHQRLDQIRSLHTLRHRQPGIDHEMHLRRFTARTDQRQSRM